MANYHVSIETNTDSITIGNYSTKREALKKAAYRRTGGMGYRNTFMTWDNANIVVHCGDEQIYSKPMFKKYLANA